MKRAKLYGGGFGRRDTVPETGEPRDLLGAIVWRAGGPRAAWAAKGPRYVWVVVVVATHLRGWQGRSGQYLYLNARRKIEKSIVEGDLFTHRKFILFFA